MKAIKLEPEVIEEGGPNEIVVTTSNDLGKKIFDNEHFQCAFTLGNLTLFTLTSTLSDTQIRCSVPQEIITLSPIIPVKVLIGTN